MDPRLELNNQVNNNNYNFNNEWNTRLNHLHPKWNQKADVVRNIGKALLVASVACGVATVVAAITFTATPIVVMGTVAGLALSTLALAITSYVCRKKHFWHDPKFIKEQGLKAVKSIEEEKLSFRAIERKYGHLRAHGLLNDADLNALFKPMIANENISYAALGPLLRGNGADFAFGFHLDEANSRELLHKFRAAARAADIRLSPEEKRVLNISDEELQRINCVRIFQQLDTGEIHYKDVIAHVENGLEGYLPEAVAMIKRHAIQYYLERNLGMDKVIDRKDVKNLQISLEELINAGGLNKDLKKMEGGMGYEEFRNRNRPASFIYLTQNNKEIFKQLYLASYKLMKQYPEDMPTWGITSTQEIQTLINFAISEDRRISQYYSGELQKALQELEGKKARNLEAYNAEVLQKYTPLEKGKARLQDVLQGHERREATLQAALTAAETDTREYNELCARINEHWATFRDLEAQDRKQEPVKQEAINALKAEKRSKEALLAEKQQAQKLLRNQQAAVNKLCEISGRYDPETLDHKIEKAEAHVAQLRKKHASGVFQASMGMIEFNRAVIHLEDLLDHKKELAETREASVRLSGLDMERLNNRIAELANVENEIKEINQRLAPMQARMALTERMTGLEHTLEELRQKLPKAAAALKQHPNIQQTKQQLADIANAIIADKQSIESYNQRLVATKTQLDQELNQKNQLAAAEYQSVRQMLEEQRDQALNNVLTCFQASINQQIYPVLVA